MQTFFLAIFTLFWSSGVLLFDGFVTHGLYKQLVSSHYPVTDGVVTSSSVEIHHGSKGSVSYVPDINYRFSVNGQTFYNDRVRYLSGFSWGRNSAYSLVNAHPANSTITVHYNAANPQDAVLFPGVDGGDLVIGLFLTPFNMVMLAFCTWAGGYLRERLFHPVAGGVKIVTDGMVTRVRLPQCAAVWWGLGVTGGLGFALTFIIGFSTNMHPSMALALATIGVVYMAGAGAYLWQQQKINSGIDDLVIREGQRKLDLPPTFGRKVQMNLDLADAESIIVQKLEHRSNKGGISYTYAPTLSLRGHEAGLQKLADWYDQRKAEDFAAWLSQKVNIPFRPPE